LFFPFDEYRRRHGRAEHLIFNQRRTLFVSALVDALAGQPVRLLTRFCGDPLERNALLGADFRENDSYEV